MATVSALPLAAALLAAATLAAADPVVYESFAYPEGRCEGQDGGTGWAGPWTDGHNAIQAGSLHSRLGETPLGGGGHFVTTNPDWAAKRMLKARLGERPGTVYVSFLIRNDTGVREENYGNITFAGDKPAFGIAHGYFAERWSLAGAKEVASQVDCNTTDPVFVVLKATWAAPGAGKVEAFFDPELGKEPRAGDIAAEGIDLPVVDRIAIVGKKAFSIDEIRIGDSWAAVCPTK